MNAPTVAEVLKRRLIFVGGKGGVGKTTVSQAVARAFADRGARTLWVAFEDPLRPPGELRQVTPRLWHLNCEAETAFEEYMELKIGVPALTRVFLQNKLMRYMAKAAPGIHELVLLGKVWHERERYDRVVVDMPSTGYGLVMFQSTRNFANLFKGGPVHRDAEAMHVTFGNPRETGHLLVALPEEMPLRESLELNEFLLRLFPSNPSAFVCNRRFPTVDPSGTDIAPQPDRWPTPVPRDTVDYARKRSLLEVHNLRLWRELGLPFAELPFLAPPARTDEPRMVETLARELAERTSA
jgi:hypothetical protein